MRRPSSLLLYFVLAKFIFLAGCSTAAPLTKAPCPRPDLDKQIADLRQKIEKQKTDEQKEVDKAKKAYDQLAASLKNEINKDQISINQYKGVLTINMVDEIFFDSGHAEIKKGSFDVLNRVGSILKNLPDKIIQIEGHTDDVPIAETYQHKFPNNWYLGAARAVNVAVYFEKKIGIDPTRLAVLSFSKYRPLVPNTSKTNRAKNRRIEIVVVDRSLYQMMEMKHGW
jgi:chemotaxis protein MotB